MSTLAKTLSDEIRRLARREINQAVSKLRKDQALLKRALAEQKRRSAGLEKAVQDLVKRQAKLAPPRPVPVPGVDKIPVYSRGIKSLRKRLGVTQSELGKLIGVSPNSIVNWERTRGKIRILKSEVKATLLALKSERKVAVWERLGKKKPVRKRPGRRKTAGTKTSGT